MGIFSRFLKLKSCQTEYPDYFELRRIWDAYSNQWPINNEQYKNWKPISVLPAPKWEVKRAIKLGFAEWPEPIDWGVFSPFFMEFVDLANHLPEDEYSVIQRFRKRQINSGDRHHDPLLTFELLSNLAVVQSVQQCEEKIVRVRDGLRRSAAWNPVGADDRELDTVRRILLKSTTEYASLIQEWRFYILSIGRDTFFQEPPACHPRIVLLDDEPILLDALGLTIERSLKQATILKFSDPQLALQEILRTPPNLFTTDINHSSLSCEELLRSLASNQAKFPIFVISSDKKKWQELSPVVQALNIDVTFIEKPWRVD